MFEVKSAYFMASRASEFQITIEDILEANQGPTAGTAKFTIEFSWTLIVF